MRVDDIFKMKNISKLDKYLILFLHLLLVSSGILFVLHLELGALL